MILEVNGGVPALTSEPVDPVAAQPNAATTDAQTGGADGGDPSQVTPKSYSEEELQDRIERATAKAAAKAERRAFREATQRLQSQQPAPQQHSQLANDGRPSRAQFGNDEAYVEALTDWKLDQREQRTQQARQQEQQRTLAEKTETIYAKAEKLPGFDRDAFDELPLTRSIVEALVDSEVPDKLMHYMAANPAEVERIAKLSPARQAAELGKLETKVAAAPANVKPSKAPDPISPVGSRSTSTASSLPQDSDDMDTWMRKERERLRKR